MLQRTLRRVPAPVLLAMALAPVPAIAYLVSATSLDILTYEDRAVEYAQAAGFLAAGVVFLVRAARRRGRDLWGIVLGTGFVIVAGEEVSWGQRIFGISTPDGLAETNVQGELNLHNLDGIHGNIRALGVVVIITLFVLLPLAVATIGRVRSLTRRLQVPEVPLWAVPLALVALAYMVVPRLVTGTVYALDEIGELYVAVTATAYALAASGWHVTAAAPALDEVLATTPNESLQIAG